MKVSEIINQLSRLDQNLRVVCNSSDFGYDDIGDLEVIEVAKQIGNSPVPGYGRYDDPGKTYRDDLEESLESVLFLDSVWE